MDESQPFIQSYSRFNEYPENLVEDANRHRSHRYKAAFNKHEKVLFRSDNDEDEHKDDDEPYILVPLRDFGDEASPTVRNISNEESLREYFGETVPGPPPPLRLRLKPDPKCRFILLETPHAEARRLNLTKSMLLRILTYHQVPSCYLNFITFFASKTSANDTNKYIQVQAEQVHELDLQLLYIMMDLTEELQSCLSSNHKVLKLLEGFYSTQFCDEMRELDNLGWKDECAADIAHFVRELHEIILEVEGIANRAEALATMVNRRENFISKVLQNQTNYRMYEETITMSLLQKIAFIYLPVSIISVSTTVSIFLSTRPY
ncbi:hypothetical protein DL768_009660 [Monosporascus sp. mg162]|nr:hypothetical protein DL768_009660 [Monosporascus sp. mg162]